MQQPHDVVRAQLHQQPRDLGVLLIVQVVLHRLHGVDHAVLLLVELATRRSLRPPSRRRSRELVDLFVDHRHMRLLVKPTHSGHKIPFVVTHRYLSQMISQFQKPALQALAAALFLHPLSKGFRQKLGVGAFEHRGDLLHLFFDPIQATAENRPVPVPALPCRCPASPRKRPRRAALVTMPSISAPDNLPVNSISGISAGANCTPGFAAHGLKHGPQFLLHGRIEQRDVNLGAALALQVDGQKIGSAGEQHPQNLAAIARVAHLRGDQARRRGWTSRNRLPGRDRPARRRLRRSPPQRDPWLAIRPRRALSSLRSRRRTWSGNS